MTKQSLAALATTKVDAIRAFVYPARAVDPAHGHCGCRRETSIWRDLYLIDHLRYSAPNNNTVANNDVGSNRSDNDSGKGGDKLGWVGFVVAFVVLVCAMAAFVYDASRLLRLWAMVVEANAIILPVSGKVGALFDRWRRSELVFWWIHSISVCLAVPLSVAIFIARVCFGTSGWVYACFVPLMIAIVGARIIYRVCGYRDANRHTLDVVISRLRAISLNNNDDDDDDVDDDNVKSNTDDRDD
jgi:hypothetical protein